jgi:hypothetical protein
MKKIIHKIKPPCRKCPYKLGKVSITVEPCRNCKENGYNMYEKLAQSERECTDRRGQANSHANEEEG